MNYYISNLIHDWKYWAKIAFAVVATMNLADILSAGLAWPGFFGLWVVRVTVGAGISGLVAYYICQSRRDRKSSRLDALLPAFIAERRVYFEKMIAADPAFQTFCFKCLHYDHELRACGLRLAGRKIKVKLDPAETSSRSQEMLRTLCDYCLYWNVTDHPIMELTDKLAFKEVENPGPANPG